MQITFYVLNDSPSQASSDQSEEAFLAFVCKLTQTVMKKSNHTLLILDDNLERLKSLDKQLWEFDTIGFIPHDLCLLIPDSTDDTISINTSIAPVLLANDLPDEFAGNFDGVVLNLARSPLPLTPLLNKKAISDSDSNIVMSPERVLEIIPADSVNKQKGRDKYTHYKQIGYQLEVHKI